VASLAAHNRDDQRGAARPQDLRQAGELHWDANVLERLWRIIEGARAAWEWWSILALLGLLPAVPTVLAIFEGQPLSVIALDVVVAVAFWVVIGVEGKAIIGESRQRRAARLMALRDEGVAILNRRVRDDGAVLRHRGDVDVWDQQVIRVLKEVRARQSDIGWFRTLGTFQPRLPATGNEMYDRRQNLLAEKLERLMVIAQRIEDSKA